MAKATAEAEAPEATETTEATEQVKDTFSLGEAADFLNRSIGYFNADRKATLVERGATLGGRGVGSSISRELLEELANEGWRDDRARSPRASRIHTDGGEVDDHPLVQEALGAIYTAEEYLEQTQGRVAIARDQVKEAKKNLTAARRTAQAEIRKASKKPTAQEKALAEIEAEEKELAKRQARLEKKKARALAKLEDKND